MCHKRSVDNKGRRMERRKDSKPDEQDVQNERTRKAKTVESPRNKVKSRKKEIYGKLQKKKKKKEKTIDVEYCRSERERLNEAELWRRKKIDRGNAKMQKQ